MTSSPSTRSQLKVGNKWGMEASEGVPRRGIRAGPSAQRPRAPREGEGAWPCRRPGGGSQREAGPGPEWRLPRQGPPRSARRVSEARVPPVLTRRLRTTAECHDGRHPTASAARGCRATCPSRLGRRPVGPTDPPRAADPDRVARRFPGFTRPANVGPDHPARRRVGGASLDPCLGGLATSAAPRHLSGGSEAALLAGLAPPTTGHGLDRLGASTSLSRRGECGGNVKSLPRRFVNPHWGEATTRDARRAPSGQPWGAHDRDTCRCHERCFE